MKPRIFISYLTQQATVAARISAELSTRGMETRLASRTADGRAPSDSDLDAALSGASLFLILRSAAADSNPQMIRELDRAKARGLKVATVRLEPLAAAGPLVDGFGQAAVLDAFPPLEDHLAQIAGVLQTLCAQPSAPAPPLGGFTSYPGGSRAPDDPSATLPSDGPAVAPLGGFTSYPGGSRAPDEPSAKFPPDAPAAAPRGGFTSPPGEEFATVAFDRPPPAMDPLPAAPPLGGFTAPPSGSVAPDSAKPEFEAGPPRMDPLPPAQLPGGIAAPPSGPLPPASKLSDGMDEYRQTGSIDAPPRPGVLGRIDHYELIRKLGEGGMGIVLMARDTRNDSLVALKTMRPRYAANPQARHRFVVEARHMERMDHPNVLKVLEVCDRPEGCYYAVPLIAGGSLATQMESGEPMLSDTVLRIGRNVADALRYAHDVAGVIHRDIKPQNVLIDTGGRAMLSDFGLVRTVFNDTLSDDQQRSWTVGTGPYMPPEIVAGKAGDTRADIYSFGAMLYEMSTGKSPYQGQSTEEVLTKIKLGPPLPVSEANPSVSPGLAKVIEGCMGRELRDRYAHMADVAEDLRRVQIGQEPLGPHGAPPRAPVAPAPVVAAPAVIPAPPPPAPVRRSSAGLLVAIAAVVLIGIVIAGVLLRSKLSLGGSGDQGGAVTPQGSKFVQGTPATAPAPTGPQAAPTVTPPPVTPVSPAPATQVVTAPVTPPVTPVVTPPPTTPPVTPVITSQPTTPPVSPIVTPQSVPPPVEPVVKAPVARPITPVVTTPVIAPSGQAVAPPDTSLPVSSLPGPVSPPKTTVTPSGGANDSAALEAAIQSNDFDRFQQVISSAGVDLNRPLSTGDVPLKFAISRERQRQAVALINAGAKLNTVSTDGEPLIYSAARHGEVDVIQALVNHHVDVDEPVEQTGRTALFAAIYYNQPDAVRALLNLGADPDRKSKIARETPRSVADSKGSSDVKQVLNTWTPPAKH